MVMNMLYMIILFCSILDYLFTFKWLAQYGTEINPIMLMIMDKPLWFSFVVKNGWTVAMLVALYFLGRKNPRAVQTGLKVLVVVYTLIICNHLYGFASYYLLTTLLIEKVY